MNIFDSVSTVEEQIARGDSPMKAQLWHDLQVKMQELDKVHRANGHHGSRRGILTTHEPEHGNYMQGSVTCSWGLGDGTDAFYVLDGHIARNGKTSIGLRKGVDSHEDYWAGHVKRAEEPESVRVDGVHYRLGKNGAAPHQFNGFGGRKWRILFNDGRHVTTYDLWFQGPIPPMFREALPNNAAFFPAEDSGIANVSGAS